jgi:hypothetical protein
LRVDTEFGTSSSAKDEEDGGSVRNRESVITFFRMIQEQMASNRELWLPIYLLRNPCESINSENEYMEEMVGLCTDLSKWWKILMPKVVTSHVKTVVIMIPTATVNPPFGDNAESIWPATTASIMPYPSMTTRFNRMHSFTGHQPIEKRAHIYAW